MTQLVFEYKNPHGKRRLKKVEPRNLVFRNEPNSIDNQWLLIAKDAEDNQEKTFILENIQRFCKPEEIQRIMCVTTYVISDDHNFFLLLHKKFNKWVPPGGKIENYETPGEAAVRETYEETGLTIDLVSPTVPFKTTTDTPHGMQLNTITDKLEHLDIIYYGKALNTKFTLDESEGSQAGWFSCQQVEELDTFPEIKKWCNYFDKFSRKVIAI